MNEIVNKVLLAGDRLMSEMHLKQSGFTYTACRPFTKNTERTFALREYGRVFYIRNYM